MHCRNGEDGRPCWKQGKAYVVLCLSILRFPCQAFLNKSLLGDGWWCAKRQGFRLSVETGTRLRKMEERAGLIPLPNPLDRPERGRNKAIIKMDAVDARRIKYQQRWIEPLSNYDGSTGNGIFLCHGHSFSSIGSR